MTEMTQDAKSKNIMEETIGHRARQVATEFLRVIAGAGSTDASIKAMDRLLNEVVKYQELHGLWPLSSIIAEAVNFRSQREEQRRSPDHSYEWEMAVDKMVQGGIRLAASHFAGQRTQQAAAESLLMEGLMVIERRREQNRRGGLDG